jgi:Protein of unknown function (DUF1266)
MWNTKKLSSNKLISSSEKAAQLQNLAAFVFAFYFCVSSDFMKLFDKLKAAILPDPLMPPAGLRFAILQSAMYDQLDNVVEFVEQRLAHGDQVTAAELLRINFLKINYADLSDENGADDPEKLRETVSNCAANLESYWGITDTESTLNALQHLRTIGHRTHHAELLNLIRDSGGAASQLHTMPWNELVKLVGEFDMTEDRPPDEDEVDEYGHLDDDSEPDPDYNPDPENLGLGSYYAYQVACKRRDILILRTNLPYLGQGGTLAWDAARHSQVVRLACGAGYLSELQAKEEIQLMNTITRAHFDDWTDFGNSFLVGLEVFRGGGSDEPDLIHLRDQMPEDSREHFDAMQAGIITLVQHPRSPWVVWGW